MRGAHIWRYWLASYAIVAASLIWWAFQWRPDVKAYPVQGVDVSEDDGEIAWPTVEADGADFAYIRASEGADIADPRFAANWEGTAAAGMRHGAYHEFSLCRPAADQATNFISLVPREEDALPAAVHLSFSGDCASRPSRAHLLGQLKQFIEMVEAHTDKTVLIAPTADFESSYRLTGAIDRPLWLSGFFLPPKYGARDWAMWQASTFHRVKGISGGTHWNVIPE